MALVVQNTLQQHKLLIVCDRCKTRVRHDRCKSRNSCTVVTAIRYVTGNVVIAIRSVTGMQADVVIGIRHESRNVVIGMRYVTGNQAYVM